MERIQYDIGSVEDHPEWFGIIDKVNECFLQEDPSHDSTSPAALDNMRSLQRFLATHRRAHLLIGVTKFPDRPGQ